MTNRKKSTAQRHEEAYMKSITESKGIILRAIEQSKSVTDMNEQVAKKRLEESKITLSKHVKQLSPSNQLVIDGLEQQIRDAQREKIKKFVEVAKEKQRQEEEESKRPQEEEKRIQEEELKRKQEEELKRKQEEESKRKQEEESKRKQEEESTSTKGNKINGLFLLEGSGVRDVPVTDEKEIKAQLKRTEKLAEVFKHLAILSQKESDLFNDGYTDAANAVKNLREEMIRLNNAYIENGDAQAYSRDAKALFSQEKLAELENFRGFKMKKVGEVCLNILAAVLSCVVIYGIVAIARKNPSFFQFHTDSINKARALEASIDTVAAPAV
ncbi:cell envelope integrity protein TolA [Legionella brunensis]|uniref:cell envelope integrity protein TolA n=1 Tax=Legionella brunensis TaxID=29422 RepID=UPI0010410C32|nr:cell envelope integrity protein TolA [Legionella brunensis]